MKKNIIIGVLSIISLCFLLFAFVQKTQNEELRIQLREAEKMAIENQKLAEHAKLMAIEARNRALELATQAMLDTEGAKEAAQNTH